jgi:AcrR family transcriptional regulator
MSTPALARIANAAVALVDEHGLEALSMRALAERVGVRAPSLYKHLASRADVEALLAEEGLRRFRAALEPAMAAEQPLPAALTAYRAFAAAHPDLYRLLHDRPLPREALAPGVEEDALALVLRLAGGDRARARALWAGAHGLAVLERAGRFPPDADLEAAWAALAAAFAQDEHA